MPKSPRLSETDKDNASKVFLSGRHQQIPVDPAGEFPRTTLAAGAVLWRGDRSEPEFAVIHRPHYDDWSLAKGKVDPGENLPVTAVREIEEETGYQVRLGKLLGKVTYPVGRRTKVVYYWVAHVEGGEFKPNKEVDEIRWLPYEEAKKLLTYDLDADVLKKARKRLKLAPTTRVLYVRHARAHKRKNWHGNDDLRPLDTKGMRQAEALVAQLQAFKPTEIFVAQPDRCRQTIEPLAKATGLAIKTNPLLGDDAFLNDPDSAFEAFTDVVNRGGVPIIVSQGWTIPAIIEKLDPEFMKKDDYQTCKKSGAWALSFNNGKLTGADYLASPLPVR